MKTCYECSETKSLNDFHANKTKKDGRQNICKACRKIRDAKRMTDPTLKEKTLNKNKEYKASNRKQFFDFMKDKSCKLCGESELACLSFDHKDRSTKSFNVGQKMGRVSWPKLEEEIKKCDILCHNCHAKRTAKQFNWYKDL